MKLKKITTSCAAIAALLTFAPQAGAQVAAGDVVTSRPAPDLMGAFGPKSQVFSYATTLEDGRPTTATATLYKPVAPWTGPGPRPTLVIAPGTRGQGDQCAPSRAGLHVVSAGIGGAGPFMNTDYEYLTYQAALAQGIRVVVVDYIGLGTPGHHTYTNTLEQAHAVLDATRAGLALSGQPADSPVGFAGYSQGGGAAAAAAEYARAYAPELNIKGTFAGAPPADLKEVMKAVDGSAIVHVLGYALNGYIERDPRVGHIMLPLLNQRGREFLATAANSCVPDSIARWGLVRTNALTTTGESFYDIISRIPLLSQTMEKQKLGQHPVTGPIMIANSLTDDIIPFAQAKELGGAYCAQGGTVMLVAEPAIGIPTGSGIGHLAPLPQTVAHGIDYLSARFRDVPAPSNCR